MNTKKDQEFWDEMAGLTTSRQIIIDRPKGQAHPQYPDLIYPFDYGYLEDTIAADGDGIDVWIGSLFGRQVTGIICTVDLDQQDAEIKLLLDCTPQEAQTALIAHNTGSQAGMLIERSNSGGTALYD